MTPVTCHHSLQLLLWRKATHGDQISNFLNLLTVLRIGAAPVVLWMAIAGHRNAFFLLVIMSVATDLVDGPIARWSGKDSEFGAKLDTLADACTLLAGMLGLYILEREFFRPELPWLLLFLASYSAAATACLAKFGVLPAYHLYLSKAAAFLAGVLFLWLYLVDFSRQFFLVVVSLGVLANLESLLATWRLERFRSDIGSMFFARSDRPDAGDDSGH